MKTVDEVASELEMLGFTEHGGVWCTKTNTYLVDYHHTCVYFCKPKLGTAGYMLMYNNDGFCYITKDGDWRPAEVNDLPSLLLLRGRGYDDLHQTIFGCY